MSLRALGYDTRTQHCAHGFRTTASTVLHELGFEPDVIECQLAHARPGVGGIYNRAHRLPDRRRMMQSWADHLDTLRRRNSDHMSEQSFR
jgi:integrase